VSNMRAIRSAGDVVADEATVGLLGLIAAGRVHVAGVLGIDLAELRADGLVVLIGNAVGLTARGRTLLGYANGESVYTPDDL
jgi:hypothetical protein